MEHVVLPDFIKIDVEGHELKVIEGAKETISRALPALFIEVAYSMKNIGRSYLNYEYKKTFDFLQGMGYSPYKVENCRLKEFNPEEKPDGVHMYLFLHSTKHVVLKEYIINEKLD